MWQGEVVSATPFTKRAGAPLAVLDLRSTDGTQRRRATQQQPAPDAEKITLTPIAELQYYDFGECPICRPSDADSREHVPNDALGGQVRTMTCARCNNELGTKVEPHLDAYCTGRFQYVRFTTAGLRRKRSVPHVDMLRTDDGQFTLMARLDPESDTALAQAKEFRLEFQQREMSRVKVAVLKHAYLAACLALRQNPEGMHADEIRQVLVATRDLNPRRQAAEQPDHRRHRDLADTRGTERPEPRAHGPRGRRCAGALDLARRCRRRPAAAAGP
jgi:hypothetical protein